MGSITLATEPHRNNNVHWHDSALVKHDHAVAKGQKPCVLWLTGLHGAGKSTIANLLGCKLHQMGLHTYLPKHFIGLDSQHEAQANSELHRDTLAGHPDALFHLPQFTCIGIAA